MKKKFVRLIGVCGVRNRLIEAHTAEHQPPSVKDGFCRPCFRQPGAAHVAIRDEAVLTHDARGQLAQKILPPVSELRVSAFALRFLFARRETTNAGSRSGRRVGPRRFPGRFQE